MTHKEHFEKKKGDCPCRDEHYYSGMVRHWYIRCKATGDDCEFDNCPFYYWVFYVKK